MRRGIEMVMKERREKRERGMDRDICEGENMGWGLSSIQIVFYFSGANPRRETLHSLFGSEVTKCILTFFSVKSENNNNNLAIFSSYVI